MQINLNPDQLERTPEEVRITLATVLNELQLRIEQVQYLSQNMESLTHHVRDLESIRDTTFGFLLQNAHKRRRTAKQVVFIADTPGTRIAKIAYGLKSNGWQVVLLHKNPASFPIKSYFVESLMYKDPFEAVLLASMYAPVAYHCFVSWNFDLSNVLLQNKPGAPVIFDDYDLFTGLQPELAAIQSQNIALEKFCLENTDGICNRSLTVQVAKKHFGYSIKAPTIFFPEYCWNRPSEEGFTLRPKLDDGIHLVYVGDCCPQYFRDPNHLGCCDIDFINAVTEAGFHYHLHPFVGPSSDLATVMRDYLHAAESNPRLHIHDQVDCDELIPTISQYHYGIHAHSEKVMTEGSWHYTPQAFLYHLNNKMFDYMDAGLASVMFVGKTVDRMLKRLNAASIMSREELLKNLDLLKNDSFRKNIEEGAARARIAYDVKRQAVRLGRFYESFYSTNSINSGEMHEQQEQSKMG